jgi:hypothetical protein
MDKHSSAKGQYQPVMSHSTSPSLKALNIMELEKIQNEVGFLFRTSIVMPFGGLVVALIAYYIHHQNWGQTQGGSEDVFDMFFKMWMIVFVFMNTKTIIGITKMLDELYWKMK